MAVERLFLDNVVYGAEDVNKAFSRLTTQGVSLFQNTGAPLTDLNTAVSNLVEKGISFADKDACKITRRDDGRYQILPGTAWMSNGKSITIKDEPYLLDITPGIHYSVYFRPNFDQDTCDIVVAPESEVEGDFVLMGYIREDGDILDRREFARLKAEPPVPNVVVEIQTPPLDIPYFNMCTETIDTGFEFSHVLFVNENQKGALYHPLITLKDNENSGIVEIYSQRGVYCKAQVYKVGTKMTLDLSDGSGFRGLRTFKILLF